MSFILDALKKAESERSRKSGPVLMDVRIAAPRRRLPAWAWVLGAVLLANLLVLAWLLLRAPAKQVAAAPVAPAAVMPQPIAPPAAAPAGAVVPVPAGTSATPVPPASGAVPAIVPVPGLQPGLQPAVQPGAEPQGATQPPVTEAQPALDVDNLPTYQDLVAAGIVLPPLQLNLHVYDANPGNRYVLLNAIRLREGEFTPDGIKVERITPRGAVLDTRGRRFLLSAGG